MAEVSRRAVVKTGLWGIPAIKIASKTPVFATSDNPCRDRHRHCKVKGKRTRNKRVWVYKVTISCHGVASVWYSVNRFQKKGSSWEIANDKKHDTLPITVRTIDGDFTRVVDFR